MQESTGEPRPKSPFLDEVRGVIRRKHYSIRTEETYLQWIKRFRYFHGKRHPKELGAGEICAFLTHLAVHNHVAARRRIRPQCARFLIPQGLELGDLDDISPAKRPARLPVVFDRDEVKRILCALEGTHGLIGSLLYGSALRLLECLRLRVQDLEFGLRQDR